MTAEEFFRKKIKEKNPNVDVITLSAYLMTAEEAMIWSHEFSQLEKSEKPIIPEMSNLDIQRKRWEDWEDFNKMAQYSQDSASPYADGFTRGAKWMRDKIKGGEQ